MANDKIKLDLDVVGLKDLQDANTQLDELRNNSKSLQDQLKQTDSSSDSFDKLNKELKQTDKQIKTLEESSGKLDLDKRFEDVYESSKPLTNRLGELEDRMYELALAGQQNSDGFRELQEEAAQMRTTMVRVDESVDDLAANRGMSSFGEQVGSVGSSLRNLDFERASTQAKALANNAKNIDFTQGAKSLKQLGSTFKSLGKALLTNPVFIIAGVITGIVVVIKKLMDEIGLTEVVLEALGKVFDWLMTPIRALIEVLKDLTDALGWTSNAADELAEKNMDKLAKSMESSNRLTTQAIANLEKQIELMKIRGESEDAIAEKQREKFELQRRANEEAEENVRAQIENMKQLDKSQEDINEKKDELNDIQAEGFQLQRDLEIFEAKLHQKRLENTDEEVETNKEGNEEKLEDDKKYLQQRLKIQRRIRDLELENMEESEEKERALINTQYDRKIRDVEENENILQSEKLELIREYEEKRINELEALEEKGIEERAKTQREGFEFLMEKRKEYDAVRREYEMNEFEKQRVQAREEYQAEKNELEKALEDELITEEQYNNLKEQARANYENRINEIDEESKEQQKQREKELQQLKVQAVQNGLQTIVNLTELFQGQSEEQQERAFKINKAARMAQTIIDTYSSATKAYNSLSGIPVVGPALGAAAAAAAITAGLTNLNKIRQQEFKADESSGSSGGGGGTNQYASAGSVGGSSPNSAPTPPSLYGMEIPGSEYEDEQEAGVRQQGGIVKAIVVESDITSTQARMRDYEQRAEIG